MFKQSLYVLLIILVLSQPKFIQMLNSSILGRVAIIVSTIVIGLKNPMMALVYAFFIIAAISSGVGVENFSYNVGPIPSLYEAEQPKMNVEDREKTEKKMITPKQSNNHMPIISPLEHEEIDEPNASESLTSESFLDYSYINVNQSN